MSINPAVFLFLVFCAGIGGLIGDWRGALWGLVVGLAFSFAMTFVDLWRKQ